MKQYVIYISLLISFLSACVQCQIDYEVKVQKELNPMPVIGILTQEVPSKIPGQPENITYVPSNYVKLVESLGAVAIPIHYTYSFDQIEQLMGKINGILFTGGDLNLTHPVTGEYHRYTKLAEFIFKKAIEMNDNGIVFPLIGVCQGHQLMMIIQNGDGTILKLSERWDKNDSLIFNKEVLDRSKFLKFLKPDLLSEVGSKNLTYNIHHLGIYSDDFKNNEKLNSFYKLISTNIDESGVEYVSMTEAINYPFFTVQFHPEKSIFQFSSKAIPHSVEAEHFSMNLIDAFLEYARMNYNNMDSYDELLTRVMEYSGHFTIIENPPSSNYYLHSDFP